MYELGTTLEDKIGWKIYEYQRLHLTLEIFSHFNYMNGRYENGQYGS